MFGSMFWLRVTHADTVSDLSTLSNRSLSSALLPLLFSHAGFQSSSVAFALKYSSKMLGLVSRMSNRFLNSVLMTSRGFSVYEEENTTTKQFQYHQEIKMLDHDS